MKNSLIIIALLSAFNYAYANSDSSIPLEVSFSYDDNLNRSPNQNTAIDSTFVTLATGYNYSLPINQKSFLDLHLLAKYEDYQDTDGLNNLEITTGFTYNYKPLAGFTKATYIFKADIRVADFATNIRDRTSYEASAITAFWVTNTLSLRSGLAGRMHDSDSRVFDTSDYRLFINADLALSRHSTLYTTLNFLTGDIVSSISLDTPGDGILDIIRQADDFELDPTFGNKMIAYRLKSDITALTLGYNYILGKKQSLDISSRYAIAKANYDIDYKDLFFNISYLISFSL